MSEESGASGAAWSRACFWVLKVQTNQNRSDRTLIRDGTARQISLRWGRDPGSQQIPTPSSRWKGEADEVRAGVPFPALAPSTEPGPPGGMAGWHGRRLLVTQAQPPRAGLHSSPSARCMFAGELSGADLEALGLGGKVWPMKMSEAPAQQLCLPHPEPNRMLSRHNHLFPWPRARARVKIRAEARRALPECSSEEVAFSTR